MNEKKLDEKSIEAFRNYLIDEEKSAATVEKYIRDVRKFAQFLGEEKIIEREEIIAYKAELVKEYKGTSVNSILAALNRFLQYVGLSRMQVKRVKVQQLPFRDEDRELKEEEYRELVEKAYANGNKRLGIIMEVICSTGIRVSELKFFTVKSVKEGVIQINNKGKIRFILVPDQLQKKLLCYIAKEKVTSGSVFITAGGKTLNRSNIWREMKTLGMNTKILKKKVYPHNLRHLFARVYYQMHKDLIGLAEILGHSSIETTKIYTLTTGSEYKKRLNQLGLIS